MGRTLIFFLILNVVEQIINAGLVQLKVRHGTTTYSAKEPRSVWPYQTPDFDTATYWAFLVHISQYCSSYPSYLFIVVSPNSFLAKGPTILYAVPQFLYYHQKVSATVINTAPVLPLSCRFSFDSACSPLPAVYKSPQIKKRIVVTHNKFEVQWTCQGVYLNIQLITYRFDSRYDTHCYIAT